MKTLNVDLSDEIVARLEAAAEHLGVSPEKLLAVSVEEKLAQLDRELHGATDHVLAKNAELYRRLA